MCVRHVLTVNQATDVNDDHSQRIGSFQMWEGLQVQLLIILYRWHHLWAHKMSQKNKLNFDIALEKFCFHLLLPSMLVRIILTLKSPWSAHPV